MAMGTHYSKVKWQTPLALACRLGSVILGDGLVYIERSWNPGLHGKILSLKR